MRKLAGILLVSLAACDIRPPDHELRFGLTEEEIKAGPGRHGWKGAILYDFRVWRELDKKADQGMSTCPVLTYSEEGLATCANDEEPFTIFDYTKDLADQPHRVRELAYFCEVEKVYYYHYVGGRFRLDTWQGPFPIRRTRAEVDLGENP